MNHSNKLSATTVFASIQNAISEVANVEPDEVNVTDHLENDLFLTPSTDIPKVLSLISLDLGHEFDPDMIADYIAECEKDEEKASITELMSFVQDEVEFS
jgi:acyl carrier protein